MNSWKTGRLGDFLDVKGGKRLPKGASLTNQKNTHPYIRVRDLGKRKILNLTDEYEYVDDITQKQIARYIVSAGDIVISIVGTIGLVGIVGKSLDNANLTENCVKLVNINGLDRNFLYYYLLSTFGQAEINRGTVGAVQPKLPIKNIQALNIHYPNISEQIKIGNLLSSIDEKIATNEYVNDNLEQQAQALFQELFITNTDPSWETGTISNLGTVIGGSTPSKARPEYYTKNGIAWITPKDLSINKSKFITHGESDITELGLKNSSATVMPEGTVLFSSRAPIGYIAIAAGNITTNQGFKSVVPNAEIGTAYVYYYLKQNLSMIERLSSGSTFKEVSGGTMKSVPAIVPDSKTIQEFNNFCLPIFEQQKVLETQNRTLAGLRDTLLPKLMSGELDVSAIEI